MKTYAVSGFALVTVGVRYTGIGANSMAEAIKKAAQMFDDGDIRLTQDVDENTAFDFDPISAEREAEI